MRKKIKKRGNSLVITFNKEEQEVYKIKEGKIIEIEDKNIKVM